MWQLIIPSYLMAYLSFFITEQSAGFYYIEASLPRVKGERARLETQYILPRYNCLVFSYHMRGGHMGKLSVYLKSYKNSELILLWRLVREQSTEWQRGEIPIQSNNTFKVCNASQRTLNRE